MKIIKNDSVVVHYILLFFNVSLVINIILLRCACVIKVKEYDWILVLLNGLAIFFLPDSILNHVFMVESSFLVRQIYQNSRSLKSK